MKRIFIAFALLLICLSAAGAELWYIGNTADSFTRRIEKIDALMMKDDFTKATKLCGEVSSDWDKSAGAKKGLASIKGSEYPKFDNIF